MSRKTALVFSLTLLAAFCAYGDESPPVIDQSRVFPVQKNPIIERSHRQDQNKDEAVDGKSKKSDPKDTKLSIDGNGGSSNRSAGGKATLRQRIPFD
ncbi:hypothetical protein [Polynucleobacter sp. UK-Kesae-W10]|jgi:hypothetical protein|uniref:hypothetical protein n=1 Tax=Polynucleobacter sp. UK-Kesae-W10 TaxID=1819738 RepID=UPI001C0DB7F1|nr:hypothetical protein [Polynucleobacter sp. UK-Kesae-W10]MBU3578266.1 hypothetical protein [Polynucleobacter sp. UK-Kesae-W10]